MQNISFDDNWVKSVSKDDFLAYCKEHGYDAALSETDIIGYWTRLNPTPKAEKPVKVKE
ncbi:MAG: hypothetical protein K0Q79_2744 [Flavipsychrobacter sp.]|jgi:hypothetical protein|nr:hypothetical protein [Flavipsychrobacter sp.]